MTEWLETSLHLSLGWIIACVALGVLLSALLIRQELRFRRLAGCRGLCGVHVCMDCGCGTRSEYYHVHDRVWVQANPAIDGMLCIGCLESRLGRQVTREDFSDAPINVDSAWAWDHSARLRDRLNRKAAA